MPSIWRGTLRCVFERSGVVFFFKALARNNPILLGNKEWEMDSGSEPK